MSEDHFWLFAIIFFLVAAWLVSKEPDDWD
jgi:hypothetical protein